MKLSRPSLSLSLTTTNSISIFPPRFDLSTRARSVRRLTIAPSLNSFLWLRSESMQSKRFGAFRQFAISSSSQSPQDTGKDESTTLNPYHELVKSHASIAAHIRLTSPFPPTSSSSSSTALDTPLLIERAETWNTSNKATTWSIQLGEDRHLDVRSDMKYLAHDFNPNLYVKLAISRDEDGKVKEELHILPLRAINIGEILSINYNLSEYDMASPFVDHVTGIKVQGWKQLSEVEKAEQGKDGFVVDWIKELEVKK